MSYNIAITGGIGSGKTSACMVFETLGIPVYYADTRAKELMNADPELKSQLTEHFGEHIYHEGVLNRRYLAEIIFNDRTALAKINSCVHPAVARDFDQWRIRQTSPYVLEEAAIIFENHLEHRFDKVILVTAPENLRIERVCARRQITPEEVRQRLTNQWTEERKTALADYIIYNDHKRLMIPQVLEIHRRIMNA